MKALFLYHLRSSLAGKVLFVAVLLSLAAVSHFGFYCQLVFDEAGKVTGGREYGAERPYQEVTETLTFAGLLLLLLMIGATAHLVPNLLRKGFLDSLHARPVTRRVMLLSAYLAQWIVIAAMTGGIFLCITLVWGVEQGLWIRWLPLLAGTFAVEAAGVAAMMLLFGVLTEGRAATSTLTILVGVVVPALLDKVGRSTDPGSLASGVATAGLAVIPRTLLLSNEISLGMSGHAVSYVSLGQIIISSALWVLVAISIFVRRDY
jgi:hypothetical protein